jgi:3-dehydrotetronate 4-kinase
MAALLGCIADDFTGGTDLAGMLVKHGMRTVQMIGVPQGRLPEDVDAMVVALKSRTTPVPEAVAESLAALRWLQQAGCRQFYFKYCSTFDSTPRGNIGPVAEALMDALGTGFTIACPAFPANRRTVYQGYLFVGNVPLNESGMQHHPLTPMTDANLVRVLQQQVKRSVGLVDYATVGQGAGAIVERFAALRGEGCGFAIVDAISDRDLEEIGAACADLPLVTAGSGIAVGLPENFRRKALLPKELVADALPVTGGLRAVIAGSCSSATRGQVATMRVRHPAFNIDPVELARGSDVVGTALTWAAQRIREEPVLIYATATPEEVKAVQAELGVEKAGALVENALAAIAQGLVRLGIGQLIVAGGETSGAVVKALGVKGLRIGPEIDPGVPWTAALQQDSREQPLALALKSGNFGTPDFFLKAWSHLQ